MLLLRTVCTTDWKGRPSHSVVLVAKTEGRKEALVAMDKDVAEWMAVDIAADEYNELSETDEEPEAGWDKARAAELVATKTPAELLEMWRHEDRFEMRLEDADHREFVERMGGDLCTIVYHLLRDDHTYTDRR